MNKYELRFEVRAEKENRHVQGKAISFETESNDLGFIETLKRGCITDETIKNSNIVFTYNHQRDRILARSKYGQGNLNLQVRDDGVYFSFEAPNTTLGNDVLEDIRCGNLSQCSFAFTIPNKEGAQRWYKEDGVLHRDVYAIDQLYDCSIVVDPAYDDTYVAARNAEISEIEAKLAADEEAKLAETRADEPKNDEKPEEKPEEKDKETPENKDKSDENKPENDEKSDEKEAKSDENKDENKDKSDENDDKKEEKRNIESEQINNQNKKEINRKIHMNKFSLVKAIRSAMNGTAVDEATANLMDVARKEMRASGINFEGQIQIPFEYREVKAGDSAVDAIDTAYKGVPAVNPVGTDADNAVHDDVIELNFTNMLKPLYENSVIFNTGATVMSGLVGDIKVPELKDGGSFAGWAGEMDEADKYFAKFDSFTISPKRLTVVTAISKQLLAQDSIGVENALRENIMKKFSNKLEATIFGNGAGDADTPAGILNGLTQKTVTDYKSLCELEASPADEFNNFANFSYILSPKAKAALRTMIKANNNTGMVLAGDSVDGTPSKTTTFLKNTDFLYLDPSAIWICQWGGLDITVDTITLASKAMVKLVLNMYVNVKYVRAKESIIYGKIAAK